MNLHSLLTFLSTHQVKLSATDDGLQVDAPKGVLTDSLRSALAAHKAEILHLLRQNSVGAMSLPPLIPDPDRQYEPFPLTDMQHAFWVGRSGVLELGNVANHGYYEIDADDLDLERLNRALQQLIDRHDMLRAIVLPDGQQQVLAQVPPYQLHVRDLSEQSPEQIDAQLETIREQMSHQVLPADRYPLFDFRATRLAGRRVRLHISYDLQVFDAWSLFRLFDEWFQLYQHPETQLSPLELTFRDYVLAEQALKQTELYQRSRAYWLNRIDSLPPAPDLPLAKRPSELQQHRTRRHEGQLAAAEWQRLKQRSAKLGLTPSVLLLAAFAEVLAAWSKTAQFTINLALFNRLPLHPQVNQILGDFTSVTLLAVDHSQPESFANRAVRLQQQLWQDLEHRYISGVEVTRELARRNGTAPSAMPIVFTSTLGFRSLGQETLTFSHFGELVYGISQASQAWIDVQVWEEKDSLSCNWDVVEDLFPDRLIGDMVEAYFRFLHQLAASESAWHDSTRQWLSTAQLAQRRAVNATDAPILDQLLHIQFAEQVHRNGDADAIITSQRRFTYRELYQRSNQLAHRLRSIGVQPNQLIAIVMQKGWEQIVSAIGILTAGAAYVPLDPELPPEHLSHLLNDSQTTLILTQSWIEPTLPQIEGIQRWCIDRDDLTNECDRPLEPLQSPDDLAYVIYTSGSTGFPKGVMICHRNVVNVVTYTNQRFQIGPADRMFALTALHHDLSVYDIFGLLTAGGAIVLPDADRLKDPGHWIELMTRAQVTLWNSVPAFMEMLVNQAEGQPLPLPASLRLAILGGDWLPVSLPDRLKALATDIQILSIGGPTETTIWNIGHLIEQVDPNWTSIPYGQPMPNSKYYILNPALEDCPVWVAGEMYCSGVQLAKGYWRNPEQTAARFITHPRTGDRLYRTGDLGRYWPDGTIEFLGRVDFQLKLRGHRMEAGEIEAALMQHSDVRSAIVAVEGDTPAKQRLVAYVVASPGATLSHAELNQFLAQKLPGYMVPSAFVWLDALPLSANGKIDRSNIKKHYRRAFLEADLEMQRAVDVAPQNEREQAIAAIWRSVLDIDRISVYDNFFDIGGNSLLITQVYRELGKLRPDEMRSISLVDLFKYPTIRALVEYLDAVQGEQTAVEQSSAALETRLALGKTRLMRRLEKSKGSGS